MWCSQLVIKQLILELPKLISTLSAWLKRSFLLFSCIISWMNSEGVYIVATGCWYHRHLPNKQNLGRFSEEGSKQTIGSRWVQFWKLHNLQFGNVWSWGIWCHPSSRQDFSLLQYLFWHWKFWKNILFLKENWSESSHLLLSVHILKLSCAIKSKNVS